MSDSKAISLRVYLTALRGLGAFGNILVGTQTYDAKEQCNAICAAALFTRRSHVLSVTVKVPEAWF